ncbi:MAG: S1 RNA-binding domain-containing protein [Chitinispirillales bacterium]|jgi:small subunit ribosomal protein S1|nr:S1 RNA-binding domain-containing protein [Chitinispirillales bacterium]
MLDKKHDGFFDEETAEDRKSGELMAMLGGYDKKLKEFSAGEKVSGKVTRIGSEYVYLDIGAKNEAMIKAIELTGDEVKVGDAVGGFIVSNRDGETIVSKSAGSGGGTADLSALREALEARMPVQGKVTGVSKNGLIVKIMGHRSFCPVSQIDVRYTSDVNEYLNKTLDFVITRITEGGKNIVVSRVPLFEAGLEEQFKKFADTAGSNKVFKGKVSKVAEFGLFVEIGGLEGLVHISEVSWQRAQNLSESFAVGKEVEFVVLKAERKDTLRNSKISLSMKQALDDPWKKVADGVTVGETLSGKVTRLADFGAFVEVIPGVEGLVHVSEMAWGRRVHHPSEIVAPGQAVRVTVLGIDHNKKSISLTLKDMASDPWNGIEEKLAVGTDVSGTVARKAKFGYFIDLFEGVTGLLVFSRMAADKKDSLKPGDTVTVQVESIDTEARRVALSMGVSDSNKDTEETKQYLKKQDAKPEKEATGGGASSDTAMGAALLAAGFKKPKPAAKVPAAAKTAAPKADSVSTTSTAAADKTSSVSTERSAETPLKPASVSTPSTTPVVDKSSSVPAEKSVETPSEPASAPTATTEPAVDKSPSVSKEEVAQTPPKPVTTAKASTPVADKPASASTKEVAETP